MKLATTVALATALGVVSLLGVSTARATIQPILQFSNTVGGTNIATYSIELTPNNGLLGGITSPSAVVIVDFPGLTSAAPSTLAGDVTALSDWSVFITTTGAGPLPDTTLAGGTFTLNGASGLQASTPDSANASNVVLQYTGSGLPVSGTQRTLLHLTITSTTSITAPLTPIQSLSRNSTSVTDNQVDTFPVLPVPSGGVPEPASLGLLGLGVLGLALRRRR